MTEWLSLKIGSRAMVLGDHLKWPGANLSGWECIIMHVSFHDKAPYPGYTVKFPWWKKYIYLPRSLLCPVYNDCEVCGYGAWKAVNHGTDKAPDWHHFCAWHLPPPLIIDDLAVF